MNMLLSFSALVLACQIVFAAPISFEHDTVNVDFPRMGSGAPSLGVVASIPSVTIYGVNNLNYAAGRGILTTVSWVGHSHGSDGEGDAAPTINGVIEGLRPPSGSDPLR
ncbi:hypothetical protein PHLGIDRAFT_10466 [Phlebiopsis gigantea 11061_1 CR5-6]|uniref:Uncharacterized protein n=1 Tax=Phlebiopsis gigantea (strain 11061_1 CR5-6) TaxID=745531 RepID=A0A0C3SDC6_PHLG1|nr:hypothetical protein PHLGIDRAFT_10466 [Phlebiopsis gigantea 11061_1 CR5-6]